jgi:general secretion pathway protein K
MPMMKFNQAISATKGVALVQVLFITAILSIMALHFTLTSRQQVNIATTMQDKVAAELLFVSWKNELLYALLTQPVSAFADNPSSDNLIAQHWNFYGKPFSPADNVQISIQDIYGMLSLTTPGMQNELRQLLRQVPINDNDAQRIIDSLQRWQGFDSNVYQPGNAGNGRNMFLQSLSEFKLISDITVPQFNQLAPAITALPNVIFNPLTAPDIRLKSVLSPDVAQQVIQLRQTDQLDAARYIALTGITDYEFLSFVPGQRFMLELTVTHGTSVAKQRFICYIRPENQFPLIWLD